MNAPPMIASAMRMAINALPYLVLAVDHLASLEYEKRFVLLFLVLDDDGRVFYLFLFYFSLFDFCGFMWQF